MSDHGTTSAPPVKKRKKEKRDDRKPHFEAGASSTEDSANHPARVRVHKPEPHHRYARGYKRSTRTRHAKKKD